jgi:2-polyprenyl-6-methoxyphenol hydroxylase-like FAD-dependent oxidoreductase
MSGTFKAIIVGGGPTGLCLAHALSLAGIDYVLLERRGELVEKTGFALALWPQSIRILDQLGLLEEAQKIYHPQWRKHNMWPDGSEMTQNDLHVFIEQR